MAKTKRGGKRAKARKPAKRGAAQRKASAGRARKAPRRGASQKAATRKPAVPRKGARRKPKAVGAPIPLYVTLENLHVVALDPIRIEANQAILRGERVQLLVGRGEEGERVETLVLEPSGKAAQSSGEYVHRGDWNGTRLLTDKGHTLDVDGTCFCRDCETAGGYTIDDDE